MIRQIAVQFNAKDIFAMSVLILQFLLGACTFGGTSTSLPPSTPSSAISTPVQLATATAAPTATPQETTGELERKVHEDPNNPSLREKLVRRYLEDVKSLPQSSAEDLQKARDILLKAQNAIGPFPNATLADLLRQVNANLESTNKLLISAYLTRAGGLIATRERAKCKEGRELVKKALDADAQNQEAKDMALVAEDCLKPVLIAQGSRDFSGTQGANNWQYLVVTPSSIQFLTWDNTRQVWSGFPGWIRIDRTGGHPPFMPDSVVRRWASNIRGTVQVKVTARKVDCGGDGITMQFLLNGNPKWTDRLGGCETSRGSSLVGDYFVNGGDLLDFALFASGNTTYDYTYFDPEIYLSD